VKIVCPVKQVPAPGAIEFDPETRTLKRDGVPLVLNPFDVYAVQHAVALRAASGGEVVVITMGPPQAEEALRECLALGADRGILLSDRVFGGADTIGTTRTLAFALEKEGFDLVLCGRKAIDAETSQVPPELGAFLNVPCLTNVAALAANGEVVHATRDADDAEEVWEIPGPAVLSIGAPPDAPASADGGERIDTWSALDLVDEVLEYDKRFGQTGSPTRVLAVRDVTPERARAAAGSVAEAKAKIDELLAERVPPPAPWEKPPHAAEKPAAHYDSWVFVETRGGEPTRASRELLARSRELAGKLGGSNVALTFGDAGDLGRHGAERVVRVNGSGLVDAYHPEFGATALRRVLERRRPHVLLLPASTIGRDFGARAAGELQFAMTADCVGVDIAKAGRLLQQKPAFGGNIVSVIMGATTPQLATVRARMYEPLDPRTETAADEIEEVELPTPSLRLLERQPHDAAGAELDEADIVLLLGEGAPDLDHAVIGVTQRVVERGDAPRRRQVGLLGRQIAPRLLVAVGVPGTPEEISGFVKARVVVSIAGGDAMNERADIVVEGDPTRLAPSLVG
jgi:electron transfer flavoprotein alpha subunit